MKEAQEYFPAPDAEGGWRTLAEAQDVLEVAGMDKVALDAAFKYIQVNTKNGGLLVVRYGWLVYEKYFGRGCRDAAPNLASCGKSFTSIAMGILLAERPDLFPAGLEQRVFTPDYLPPSAFPLSDPAKAEIKLGQLLAFSAGIRGNNPAYVKGRRVTIEPVGPDGWPAMVDEIALGQRDGTDREGRCFTTSTLWCAPGEGYSYATSSIHIVSIIQRHVTGMELQEYVADRLARPLGWGRWSYGYRYAGLAHTPGGGGICLRATDMLRFGYLLLRQGRWGDRQLVPAEYIRHASRRSPYNPHYPYSLQFTVNSDGWWPALPRDAYWKAGSGGHALYVVPSLDLVVWKLGGRDGQYEPTDTGLPVEYPATGESQEGWAQTVDDETALLKTLELVVGAIRRP